jgi:branched-chain amino acid transport system ATP-binding protein
VSVTIADSSAVPLLKVDGLSKSFGKVQVANDLNFSIQPGEALGIIGPNGAGKSSIFNLIGGNLRPDRGRIFFEGQDVTRLRPYRRCRDGIGRTYQIPQPFSKITVFENLLISAVFGGRISERESYEKCARILERTGLLKKANTPAGLLTLLERKRLELARALASSPRLLLLDEIAGGLTEREAAELVATIQEIHAAGTAILWIEHVVHALTSVIGRLMVIDFGSKIMDGDPSTVLNSAEVKRIYLGIEIP